MQKRDKTTFQRAEKKLKQTKTRDHYFSVVSVKKSIEVFTEKNCKRFEIDVNKTQ